MVAGLAKKMNLMAGDYRGMGNGMGRIKELIKRLKRQSLSTQ